MKRSGRKLLFWLLMEWLLCTWLLTGCAGRTGEEREGQLVEFTVADAQKLPPELQEIIEENKEHEIRLAYQDGADLYLVRGYGQQKSGGYSISVTECAEDEETIWMKTQLIGPAAPEKQTKDPSYPVLVAKMEMREKEAEVD